MTDSTPGAIIVLDAFDLDQTLAFWHDLLAFETVQTDMPGSIMERRRLASPRHPAVHLLLRRCDPRPPIGSCVGSFRRIEFPVDDPAAAAGRIEDPVWIEPPPDNGDAAARLTLRDPNGYHVSLVTPDSLGKQ